MRRIPGAIAIGIVCLIIWWPLAEYYFAGDAPSLFGVDAFVLAIAVGLLVGLIRWTGTWDWRIFGKLFIVASLTFAIAATGTIFVLNMDSGECGPSTRLGADWTQPGIAAAAEDGFPGTTEESNEGVDWARFFELDDVDIRVTITPADRIFVSSSILDWPTVQGHLNATIGQDITLTYDGAMPQQQTTVC